MKRVLFVCHGNICRSPMAHFVFQHLVEQAGRGGEFTINSAATHMDELGSPIYPPARRKLLEKGVPLLEHRATLLSKADYGRYDYIIGMDSANLRNMHRIFGGDPEGKVSLLLDRTDRPRDVADPWYTGDFDATWRDISTGCKILLQEL